MENASEDIKDIAFALCKAQAKMGSAVKDTQGYGYKYAELSAVQEVVRQPFAEHDLSYTHIMVDGKLRCILMHKSGQWLASDYPLNAQANKNLNINQAMGSAITYGRRYTLAALAGIPQEDDDGVNSAPKNQQPVQKPVDKHAKMQAIFREYKKALADASTLEQRMAYSHQPEARELFEYATTNPDVKKALTELLQKHDLVELMDE